MHKWEHNHIQVACGTGAIIGATFCSGLIIAHFDKSRIRNAVTARHEPVSNGWSHAVMHQAAAGCIPFAAGRKQKDVTMDGKYKKLL
eukprot:2347426-Amphidinium_carterae.1